MRENCLDIGTIQAFLDAELSHEENAVVSSHIAACNSCAMMLAEAEEESAIVFPALEREMNSLVPTQRLWNKINENIREEQENRPIWEKAFAFLRLSLTNPSMIAAASLLIVFGLFGSLWITKNRIQQETPQNVAVASRPAAPQSAPVSAPASVLPESDEVPVAAQVEGDPASAAPRIERAVYRPEARSRTTTTAAEVRPTTASLYMPGEENYVKTISTLAETVDTQKDGLLRPAERIAYERDMAVVNDTISKMRTEVKRNPRNETAKQILYSSYQNKIDLLNSVAQKEELMASLK